MRFFDVSDALLRRFGSVYVGLTAGKMRIDDDFWRPWSGFNREQDVFKAFHWLVRLVFCMATHAFPSNQAHRQVALAHSASRPP